MSKIFFYGLFMDRSLLTGQGLDPRFIGLAELSGYRIHIGERATLLRSDGDRALGVVMELSDEEARALYSEPGVQEYVPERVRAELRESRKSVEVECYNLPPGVGLTGANPAYARKLARLVEDLGFEPAYVEEVAAFC